MLDAVVELLIFSLAILVVLGVFGPARRRAP
jgi:hypothetical protein